MLSQSCTLFRIVADALLWPVGQFPVFICDVDGGVVGEAQE